MTLHLQAPASGTKIRVALARAGAGRGLPGVLLAMMMVGARTQRLQELHTLLRRVVPLEEPVHV